MILSFSNKMVPHTNQVEAFSLCCLCIYLIGSYLENSCVLYFREGTLLNLGCKFGRCPVLITFHLLLIVDTLESSSGREGMEL